ncbi:HAMP domain-containing sensor histidine kinase [Nocardioides sp. InS609-2]|uniref:sensor histidine kinase n=1 Tax=Nocardioides sp. InS609-2 TaxID=2760705 RepID=UPI0020C09B67|nr:HAMP domain-containing sensor histidine kinase [Nocardioides sp. InS609-2]
MQDLDPSRAESVRRLFDLMRRVNSSTETGEVLEEIARGVVEVLGFGVAAIARLEGDYLVMTACVGPDDVRAQIIGRRNPKQRIMDEFRQADKWGILRYVPHGRVDDEFLTNAWIPDYEPDDDPQAWHPEDALYAPLYSATGELLGNMAVDFPPGNRIPNQALRDLLELFVVQAGLALSNAQQRERLAEQVRLGEIVKDVAMASSLVGLDSTLERSAEALAHGFGAVQTWIRCFPDGELGRSEHAAGFPAPNPANGGLPGLRRDLVRSAWPQGGAIHLTVDAEKSRALPETREALQAVMRKHHALSLVAAPLGVGVELLGYVVIMRDTDQVLNEHELSAVREIARELGRIVLNARLYERESRLVAELQELDRYKGELIATISHELKTPLTSIIGHTELLDESEHSSISVQAIARNAQRLNQLIANLLNYSRVQDKREHVRSRVDLTELCQNSLELLQFQAEAAGVRWSISRPDGAVLVNGDPDELGRIVDNIIGNAVKYSRSGGEIDVRVAHVGEHAEVAEVAVSDTGLGISQIDQGHLFSAFHRSSNPEALSIPGTGLGLAISRRIAEIHGGDISVESELGEGSTFRLRLPRADSLDSASAPAS